MTSNFDLWNQLIYKLNTTEETSRLMKEVPHRKNFYCAHHCLIL